MPWRIYNVEPAGLETGAGELGRTGMEDVDTEDRQATGRLSRRAVFGGATLALAAAAAPAMAGPSGGEGPVPAAPGIEFVFEENVLLTAAQKVGATPYGKRLRIPIVGGTFSGKRIRGKVLSGGADWQLVRSDGCVVVDADYMIEADDGALIHVRNKGVIVPPGPKGQPAYVRAAPTFEAPIGPHDWLNKSLFVSTIQPAKIDSQAAVIIRIYRIT